MSRKFVTIRKFPSNGVNPTEVLSTVLEKPLKTAKSFQLYHKTKRFALNLLDGKSVVDAKVEAGFAPATPSTSIMSTPVAKVVFQELMERRPRFKDPGVLDKLEELWDAKSSRPFKVGDEVVYHENPEYEVQVKALDRVLKLRGLMKDDEVSVDRLPPTSIQFIEVQNMNVGAEAKDVIPSA